MTKTENRLTLSQREALIERMAAFFQRSGRQIAAVYLFDAFDKDAPFADFHVGLLLQFEKKDRTDFELDLEARLKKALGCSVEVRVLNGAPLPVCLNVIRTGHVILDRSPNARADFQAGVLKASFDFYRFRKRYYQEVLSAPA